MPGCARCPTISNLHTYNALLMKRACALLLYIMPCLTGHGQCPSNKGQLELATSYGMITASQVGDKTEANSNSLTGQSITYSSGMMFLTARYFFFNRLALGIAGGVSSERGQYADKHNTSVISRTYSESVTTIAPEVYYIYFFRKYLEVYTLLGIGPGFFTTTTTTNATPYSSEAINTEKHDALRLQYTPIGIRIGGRLGGFAELGIGYKGLINAGLSFKLGPSCWWR